MEDKSNGTDPPSPAQTPTNGLDTRSPKLLKQSLSLEEPHIRDSFPIHKHNESRPFPSSLCHDLLFEDIFTKFPKKSTISWRPLEMDPGDIWPTTGGFLGRDLVGEEEMGNKRWYGGEVQMRQKTIDVIVKTYRGGFEGEMEMEMELWASTATFHRNLMSLMGFCKDPPSLVFAYDGPGTLDQLLTRESFL
ncbi:uncharacterized protein LOC110007020 [Amborella trichopoda]|uniref:Uncharacterized protein n=1 Tax=Amborella trichopoda TaxID=13333 RepID=W1P5J8_AMBTC|nr:uncharacterized protein LOC110007020 [Amborella trichopoda]ERN03168.1 hypothetical protein AMTR_s00003p00123880 [Amborella trichopoda]|eukprot:XP_020521272.1 uncharacterized protein LOC110007020 [Amborella trichopoda]